MISTRWAFLCAIKRPFKQHLYPLLKSAAHGRVAATFPLLTQEPQHVGHSVWRGAVAEARRVSCCSWSCIRTFSRTMSPIFYSPPRQWRFWWYFLIYRTTTEEEQSVSAGLVPFKCPEDSTVQFVWGCKVTVARNNTLSQYGHMFSLSMATTDFDSIATGWKLQKDSVG